MSMPFVATPAVPLSQTPDATPAPAPAAPQISILVPIFNVEKYLDQCLASIAAQSFRDFEAICINDGSTDSSPNIIAKYVEEDGRFVLLDKPNSGYGASMNLGLKAARGKYIAILESDDFFEPHTLQALHDACVSYGAQVSRANCWQYWSSNDGDGVARGQSGSDGAGSIKSTGGKNVLMELVPAAQCGRLLNPQVEHEVIYRPPAIWSALYERELLSSNNICFTESPGASFQDTGFNFKVWTVTRRAVFLNEAFLHYRQDNAASSVKSPSKVYCVCDEFAEIDSYLAALPKAPQWAYGAKAKLKFQTYLWNYERLDQSFQQEFMQRFAQEMRDEQAGGHLDMSLFAPWEAAMLGSVMSTPQEFHAARLKYGNTKLGKARHLLKLGGLSLLAKFMVTRYRS